MSDKSSLLESISDPANGTAKLDSAVVILSDSLIKFSQAVQDQAIRENGTYSIITTIYYLTEAINNGQLRLQLDTMENQELVDTIKESLQNLPIIYHVRLMNQFLDRYYGQVIADIDDVELDNECLTLSDQLVEATKDFKNEVGLVPSPFEVIYLLADLYVSTNTMTQQELELGQIYLIDYERQKLFLADYMKHFLQAYKKEIE